MVDGDIAPQLILQFLKARAFFAQMPAQSLRADVQVLGDAFQVWPMVAVAAEQAAQLAAQAVAVVRAGQQVGGGALEKVLEGSFVLQSRENTRGQGNSRSYSLPCSGFG